MIIGLSGLIGSGKNTAAEYLCKNGFVQQSFASSLKDVVSSVFGWRRDLLEGTTEESRQFRETIDTWWASRLDMPLLTPRLILQLWGTDVIRHHFHDDMWIASLEHTLCSATDSIVISDCRFKNEGDMIRKTGGIQIWVQRGQLPEWHQTAIDDLTNNTNNMSILYPSIHQSEWSWLANKFDYTIFNDGTPSDMFTQLERIIR